MDLSQILGDERKPVQTVADRFEELFAGPEHPAALLGSGAVGWDLPEIGESTEVIDPDHVHQLQELAESGYPPGVAVGLMGIPVVQRITP